MFTPSQYRDQASVYRQRAKTAANASERREFSELGHSFTVLADNKQWLIDHHYKTVPAPATDIDCVAVAQEEEHILRCLGAALIRQWNSLPKTLRKELFDNACSMSELLENGEIKGKIARFLHKHRNDDGAVT